MAFGNKQKGKVHIKQIPGVTGNNSLSDMKNMLHFAKQRAIIFDGIRGGKSLNKISGELKEAGLPVTRTRIGQLREKFLKGPVQEKGRRLELGDYLLLFQKLAERDANTAPAPTGGAKSIFTNTEGGQKKRPKARGIGGASPKLKMFKKFMKPEWAGAMPIKEWNTLPKGLRQDFEKKRYVVFGSPIAGGRGVMAILTERGLARLDEILKIA